MRLTKLIFTSIIALLISGVSMFAQTISVSGTIVDSNDKEPIFGVAVVQQGTTNGTSTDIDGKFTLNAPSGAILEISCVGYTTQLVVAKPNVEISLIVDNTFIEEVVVTGYMSEKKADLTGSVAVVKMADVVDIPTGNVLTALQGRVAGMNITSDGTPGGLGTSSRVRGTTTINDSSPLYVIDGVMTRDDIGTIISSNDIESIQVLKDAASAAIYGAQAANGVIIITTKQAKDGEIRINFTSSLGLQTFHNNIPLLNAQEWGDVYWAAYDYDYHTTPNSIIYGNGPKAQLQLGKPYYNKNGIEMLVSDTDWLSMFYKPALMQQYNLSLSKGTRNQTTSVSFNYTDQKGILKGSDYKSFGTRINNEFRFFENRLKVGESINITYWDRHNKPNGYESIEKQLLAQHPAQAVYCNNGDLAGAEIDLLGNRQNPIMYIRNEANNINTSWRIFGNAYLEITPIKNLVIRSTYGINYNANYTNTFTPAWDEYVRSNTDNSLEVTRGERLEWVWTNTASYNLVAGKHVATFLLGAEYKKNNRESLTGTGADFALASRDYVYLSVAEGAKNATNSKSQYAMTSYFVKANYSFADKYLFSATVRRDASSRFGNLNNAGIFPSASFGWRVSKEDFMSNTKSWLTDLKLRASWGINGNDQINNNAIYNIYAVSLAHSYNVSGDGSTLAKGATRSSSGNNALKWEQTEQINIGFDAAFLNNRLNVTFDYYNKDTKDMLYQLPVPAVNGEGGSSYQNCAALNNNGLEGIVSWRNVKNGFSYEISANISMYKNKITYLPEDIYYTFGCGNAAAGVTNVGLPYGARLGHVTDGLFRTQAEVDEYIAKYDVQYGAPGVGRIRYVDVNKNGKIEDSDQAYIGSDLPKIEGGITLSGSYKGFDVRLFFSGMIRDAYNTSKTYTDFFALGEGYGNHANRLLNAANAWNDFKTSGKYTSKYPAVNTVDNNLEGNSSDWFVEDGSYLKLKNVTVGYTLPATLLKSLNLRSARVYLQAQNLFTLTKYSGPDPEALGYPYPFARSYTLGLTFGF